MGVSRPGPKATCAACDRAFVLPTGNNATVLVVFGETTQLVFLCPSCMVRGADVAGADAASEMD